LLPSLGGMARCTTHPGLSLDLGLEGIERLVISLAFGQVASTTWK